LLCRAKIEAVQRYLPHEALLGQSMNERFEIRRELRPGDLGAIVALHGRLIPPEHGLDSTHEGYIAASVARAALRGWPGEREAAWIVESDGEVAGSIALTDDGDDTAGLRWLALDPSLRGRGLGRRLVGEVVAEARRHGYARLRLETFSDLRTAAHIYREYGFELVHEETGPRWGREQVTYQHYELALRAPRGS
jgi:N-acetylglutamate synthase-like GNAT family acetyltransferase